MRWKAFSARAPPGRPEVRSEASRVLDDAPGMYAEQVLERLRPSAGMKILIDYADGQLTRWRRSCSEGWAWTSPSEAMEPTGTNINDGCGSTYVDELDASGHDVAFAFDGDADRVLAVDEKGGVVDGDRIIAILARDMKEREILYGGVVVTVMSNLGFFKVDGVDGKYPTR